MSPPAAVATLPVVRALLDEARHKNYLTGTLGIRARPEWSGPDAFEHVGVQVNVVPCVSTLSVREALRGRGDDRWLVILTDRDDTDLGAGIRSHLVWHRLRTPDPWDAVQGRFAASALDPALTTVPGHREIAAGLLAATPVDGGWPAAPGGVLTRDHAFGAVARHSLQLLVAGSERDLERHETELSPSAVLAWTGRPTTAGLVADLRSLAGDPLTDAVLDWLSRRAGSAGPPLLQLLRNGQGRQIIPLGLVLGTLLQARDGANPDLGLLAREALVRLEPKTGGATVPPRSLAGWAAESSRLVAGLLRDRDNEQRQLAERLTVEADSLLGAVHGSALAESSDLLPSGLTARLVRVAELVRTSVNQPDGVDQPAVSTASLSRLESAWLPVQQHLLAADDLRVHAFRAAIRLTRWLAMNTRAEVTDLATLHRRQVETDSWVDSAVNDAAPGVGDADLGAALSAVLDEVRRRRDRHDTEFAAALAVHVGDDSTSVPQPGAVLQLEDLLVTSVLPLAKKAPVLLLILDGMSAAVGGEIVSSILAKVADGWAEYLPAGERRRVGAVSLLPSLTEVSRASLLCGELRTGGQDVEQRGYAELARAHGLAGSRLFHKKPLDSSQLGFAVAHDVGAALDDKTGQPLVTCILNTIDDALDRSDPAGTVWTAETVKHLSPLLERARLAGRVVILTADHGHIVERRQGRQCSYPVISSGRSRAAGPLGDGEVLVAGRRVLLHDGRAVLAVDERLRYGPLKAGYHGGGAPAEVVVPVYFLVSGGQVGATGLVAAPPQEPSWWLGPATSAAAVSSQGAVPMAPVTRKRSKTPTLFDQAGSEPTAVAILASPLAAAAVGSRTYAEQRRLAGRASVTDEQVRSLLEALLAAPPRRLAPSSACVALGVAAAALRGAVLHAQRLLNVEGYPVLSLDVDGVTLLLDEALLREQFELP